MSRRQPAAAAVTLSVYDLTPNNSFLHGVGFGAYHSGLVVHGREYTFGGGASSSTGVFSHAPRAADGCVFRESIELGSVRMTMAEVERVLDDLKGRFRADEYHILHNNCNCFSDTMARALLGHGIPSWVNRLARWGNYCSCCLPPEMQRPANVPQADRESAIPLVRNNFRAFEGDGHTLKSDSDAPVPPAAAAGSGGAAETDEARRERMRNARLARLEFAALKAPAQEESQA